MLGNGIKQTTTTTGTGNLTVAAVTGYPKLSDVVPVGLPVAYSLLDSNGLSIEQGIGRLTDSTTFVRALVTATFVGGIYLGGPANTTAPTAVNLTGTTTLIVTPIASTSESMLPTLDSQSSGVTRYLTSGHHNGLITSNQTVTTLRVYYVPFLLRCGAPIVSLAGNVSSVASGVFRVGIYSCTEKSYPGVLLAGSGDLDFSATGFKTASIPTLSLPPGWYFTGVVCSAAGQLNAYTTALANYIGVSPFGMNSTPVPIDFRYETATSAVLPAVASTTTTAVAVAVTHPPITYLGVL